jgi:hypothetical protein
MQTIVIISARWTGASAVVTAVEPCRRDIVMAYRALEQPRIGWLGAGVKVDDGLEAL